LGEFTTQCTHYHKKIVQLFFNSGCSLEGVYWLIVASPGKLSMIMSSGPLAQREPYV